MMIFLQMTISGAALILLVVLLRMIAVSRLPKDTFLILWGIVLMRLLIPVSIPSVYSVYSLIDRNVLLEKSGYAPVADYEVVTAEQRTNQGRMALGEWVGAAQTEQAGIELPAYADGKKYDRITFWLFFGWCVGAFALLAFFITAYLRGLFRFRTSLPVREAYVEYFLQEHPFKRSVSVRQSGRITAPLTYGIFHPVILLPKETDWSNTVRLEYVLLHEYVHIRRFDTATKLIAAIALCLHWFNPFVWIMYALFNRDLELACDEKVIYRFGENGRAAYARTLIDMAAEQSGLMPFGNHFGRNVVEERIVAIMKWRKTSFYKKTVAIVLIAGMLAVSGISMLTTEVNAADDGKSIAEEIAALPDIDFTEEECARLLALQFNGYENMSVAQYQKKVWEYTDTVFYRNLLERFSQSETLYAARNENETAAFLFYVLEPLTAEKWQERAFSGYAAGPTAADGNMIMDNAQLEYEITLVLKKPEVLTVKAYDEARKGMMKGLADFLQSRTKEQLQDEGYMEEAILTQIDVLKQRWSTDALEILVEYVYMPLSMDEKSKTNQLGEEQLQTTDEQYGMTQMEQEPAEPRINGYASEEDYRSLFTLRSADYQQTSVADFDKMLLNWGNEHFDACERIREDYYRNDYRVELSKEELFFVGITMTFSGEENYRMIQSLRTGRAEEAPGYRSYHMDKEAAGGLAWCGFAYEFTYRLSDKNAVTIAMRDKQLSNTISDVEHFWEETDLDELLQMKKEDVCQKLNEIAAKYSNDWIEITIDEERLYFEGMDERMYRR